MKKGLPGLGVLLLVATLNQPWGSVPSLGRFFDPFHGVWANAERGAPARAVTLTEGVSQPVEIRYDSLGVAHIFAADLNDLYFAQGWVHARDRLFQMDFSTRAAGGELAATLGARYLDYDRNQRRIGMAEGARRHTAFMEADPEFGAAVRAYTAGVNAWLAGLAPSDWPVEYKLLSAEPKPWSPYRSGLMVMNLNETLNFSTKAVPLANTRALLGDAFVDRFMLSYPEGTDPIIPAGTRWSFEPVPVPAAPARTWLDADHPHQTAALPQAEPGVGSNNWAVLPGRSASGYALLANDPHLQLTLPSIWYLNQLTAPGLSAKGVSFPGVPDVVLGFNADLAWGSTNVGNAAVDLYRVELNADRSAYRHDGVWKPVTVRLDTFFVRGGDPVVDTVRFTHHGPILDDSGMAMRWTGALPDTVFRTFHDISRARTHAEFEAALGSFQNPPQNLVVADRSGSVGIHLAGRFPLKWPYQGALPGDGTDPRHDWAGWVPQSHNPESVNPARGWVSSANQHSTDPTYPYYINWDFAPFTRGNIINDELEHNSRMDVDAMRRLQLNTRNRYAELVLDRFMNRLDKDRLDAAGLEALAELERWDLLNEADRVGATVFRRWLNAWHRAVWDAHFTGEGPYQRPSRQATITLFLQEPASTWFAEPPDSLITRAYIEAVNSLVQEHGPLGADWAWWKENDGRLEHLLRLPGLGSGVLHTGGDSQSPLALSGTHGPSWRLVAEMGPIVRAFGIYPGGQSGNPGSPRYLNLLPVWMAGDLHPLILYSRPEDVP